MSVNNLNLSSLQKLRLQHETALQQKTQSGDFASALAQKLSGSEVKFSKHAVSRINDRNVPVDDKTLSGISEAVQKARDKGANEIVIIGQQGAFIVNVPNNTVITTLSVKEMRENIFTNIDGAVIL